ncbi:MAG: OB-fold nucleic acid binding domain-containing protein [Candidatus Aenigmatarchaeota archaeon]
MKIKELKLGMNEVSLKAKVNEVSEPRSVKTRMGYQTQVATAILEDDSGKIPLTLWGSQIEGVNEGDTIQIKGGYVSEFKGELQLNVPRKGELKKV